MSQLDTNRAIPILTEADFDTWLATNGADARDVVISIYNKKSGLQQAAFEELQAVALCHGWVDTQTKSIDDQHYAIRFTPRRPGSNWAATNRVLARRLLSEGRIKPAGLATLPADL